MIANGEIHYVCPLLECGQALIEGPNGEAYWCTHHMASFPNEQIEGPGKWRGMSWDERARAITEFGDDVIRRFGIEQSDVDETREIEARKATAVFYSGNVAPSKTALINLAKGLSDIGALKEIVDNALDCAQRKRNGEKIEVRIELNAGKGFVRVSDDAGGMTRDEMLCCMTLGSHTPNGGLDNVIGQFGVGAKEAMYHFGRELRIRSSDFKDPIGLELFVEAEWLRTDDWNVDIRAANVECGTTSIRVDVLEHVDFDRTLISAELYKTYARRINSGRLNISIDGEPIKLSEPPVLLYPPELYPRRYAFQIQNVAVDAEVALLDDAPDESGIFFYAFGRLYAHWLWSNPLANTIFPKPPQHHLNTHMRLEIDFKGLISDIPINANKDEVVINSPIFKPLSKIAFKIVQPYIGLVSWLSKEGNMGYLSGSFARIEKAHESVTEESPGLRSAINLGKIYETIPIPKIWFADSNSMQTTIANDRLLTASNVSGELINPPPVDPIADDRREPPETTTAIKSKTVPNTLGTEALIDRAKEAAPPKSKSTQFTVSFLTDDSRQIALFREQIISAARNIGVDVVVS